MKRTLTLFALAGLILTAAPRADARATETYRYVATGSGGVLDVISLVNTPAGRVAPQGDGRIRATGNTLTVLIDDAGVLSGDPINIWVTDAGWVCVRDSEPTNFPTVPGALYDVSVADHIYPDCSVTSGATAGTMTLVA